MAAPSPLQAPAAAAPVADAEAEVRFDSHLKKRHEDEAALFLVAGLSPAPTMRQPMVVSHAPETTAAAGAAKDGGLARHGTGHSGVQTQSAGALVFVMATSNPQAVGQHNSAAETTVVVASPLHTVAFAAPEATGYAHAEKSADDSPAKNVLQVEFDAARLLKRIFRAFATAEHTDGQTRLRLNPPELGSLQLEIRVEEGRLIARLEAETEAARTSLLDNLALLRERLAERGMQIERFDVDLMQQQTGDQPHAPPDDDRSSQHLPPAARQPPTAVAAPAAEPTDGRTPFPRRKRGRLNVII